MRGSSTAKITFENGHVRKMDSEVTGRRVRDQGIWLRRYDESLCLPAVNEVYANGYLMEKLIERPLPVEYDDVLRVCQDILTTLRDHLWHREFTDIHVTHIKWNVDPNEFFDEGWRTNVHRRYVAGLLRNVNMRFLRRILRGYEAQITWYRLRTGLTHGDPIIDNVLYRPSKTQWTIDRQLVLIDPIPACSAVPDVLAVDVGRVIQSAVGYEAQRYGDITQFDPPNWSQADQTKRTRDAVNFVLNDFMGDEFTLNDARAAIYFAIIHQLRGLRTALRVAPDRTWLIKASIIHLVAEAESWMR